MQTETKAAQMAIRQRLSAATNEIQDIALEAEEAYGQYSEEALELAFLWQRAANLHDELRQGR